MKTALMIASVSSMIDKFNMNNIKILQDLGYEVTVAANFNINNHVSSVDSQIFIDKLKRINVNIQNIEFSRSPLDFKIHMKSYKQVEKLLNNNYDLIHTHTPIASAIVRMAHRNNIKSHSKILYTAHGFHFYDGAPIKNWLFFYPLEKSLSKYTDVLITINTEDYQRAKSFFAKKVKYVPGVGVDTNIKKPSNEKKEQKKIELGINSKNILISVGELNDNKNQKVVIEALSNLKDIDFQYLIVGKGPNKEKLEKRISEYGLDDKIKLLGYRSDIQELLQISDLFIFPSYREGLSKSLMEAMVTGLPVIASKIRGNVDLIDKKKGGYLFNANNSYELSQLVKKFFTNKPEHNKQMGFYNKHKILEFSVEKVNGQMKQIYTNVM